jgi:hypothetical protein
MMRAWDEDEEDENDNSSAKLGTKPSFKEHCAERRLPFLARVSAAGVSKWRKALS